MFKDKRILIVAPHPDDEATCSGGLIMRAKKEDGSVFVLYMSVGKSRQFSTGKTNANIRIAEAKKASEFGNFSYEFAFEGEPFMRLDSLPQKELIEKIEDISEKFKPGIVIIPFRESFDQDHRATASACITAFRPLPKDLLHQPEMILEAEEPYTWGQQNVFSPTLYLDISDVFEEKIKLLKCHKTQLREDPFPRSPENLKRLAGIRGCEASVEFAEAYALLKQVIV